MSSAAKVRRVLIGT